MRKRSQKHAGYGARGQCVSSRSRLCGQRCRVKVRAGAVGGKMSAALANVTGAGRRAQDLTWTWCEITRCGAHRDHGAWRAEIHGALDADSAAFAPRRGKGACGQKNRVFGAVAIDFGSFLCHNGIKFL